MGYVQICSVVIIECVVLIRHTPMNVIKIVGLAILFILIDGKSHTRFNYNIFYIYIILKHKFHVNYPTVIHNYGQYLFSKLQLFYIMNLNVYVIAGL